MLLTILVIVVLLVGGVIILLNQASFGKLPTGERLSRIEKLEYYKDGKFSNRLPSNMKISEKSKLRGLYEFLFVKIKDLRPSVDLPLVKTNLKALDSNEDVVVWLGHSSIYLQTGGKRIAVDPVLVSASPVSFVNKAFKGTDRYKPDDLPDLDYLIITHDHWDHLDYNTMINLKDRTQQVICPLGVGEHFEYWGFDKERIIELEWNESIQLADSLKITALPARHFSGRGLNPDKSLWVSYMLQSSFGNIFLYGDGGYDIHFQDIKKKFGTIDLALVENGQYNEDWSAIHLMPEDLVKAVKDLAPRRLMTIHNSKYALGRHAWYEPLDNIAKAAEKNSFQLLTPIIGEPVKLNDSTQVFQLWWKSYEK